MTGRRLTASSKVIPGDLLFVDDAGDHMLWDIPVLDASADQFITSITFRSGLFVVLAVSKVTSLVNIIPEQFRGEPGGMHAYLARTFNVMNNVEFVNDDSDLVTLNVVSIDSAAYFRPGDTITILWGWETMIPGWSSNKTMFRKIGTS